MSSCDSKRNAPSSTYKDFSKPKDEPIALPCQQRWPSNCPLQELGNHRKSGTGRFSSYQTTSRDSNAAWKKD
eukprot:852469-Ditylum_brightwellii.AAC.1